MLRQILRSCLVDGYGTKAAAGWSMVDEGSAGFSMTNKSGSGIINFFMPTAGTSYYGIYIYLMESFTGSTNGRAAGDNVRSGPWYPGSTVTQRQCIFPSGELFGSGLASHYWTLIADENTCIFSMQGRLSTGGNGFNDLFLYFGDIASPLTGPARFVCSGGSNSYTEAQNTNNYGGSQFWAFGQGNTCLRDLNTGVIPSVAEGMTVPVINYASANGNTATTWPVTAAYPSDLSATRAPVHSSISAGKGHCGWLKGVLICPQFSEYSADTLMTALGLARSEANYGTFVGTPGNAVAVMSGRYQRAFLVTDNPAYW
jgi:hypothetical protein